MKWGDNQFTPYRGQSMYKLYSLNALDLDKTGASPKWQNIIVLDFEGWSYLLVKMLRWF